MTVKSESAGAAPCVVEHQADQGFTVVDFVGGDQSESFGERKPEDLDILVGLGPGDAFANVSGEINLHPLAQEAGACEVFGQQSPAFGAVARLFDHLAFGCGQGGFARFDASSGQLDKEPSSGVPILALEDDVRIFGIFGFIDGQHDD